MKNEENTKAGFSIKTIPALISLTIPVLYLVGYFYDFGFLSVFEVSNDFIPRSIQTYLVLSYHVVVTGLAKLLSITGGYKNLFIITIIMFWTTGIAAVLYVKNETFINASKEKLIRKRWFLYTFFPIINGIAGSAILYIVLTIILFPLMGYFTGKNAANDIKSKYQPCVTEFKTESKQEHQCTFVYKGGQLEVAGFNIAASDTYIAIYTSDKTIIQPLIGRTIEVVGKDE